MRNQFPSLVRLSQFLVAKCDVAQYRSRLVVSQSQYENLQVDEFDKQILFHLSKGVKTKDLPSYVPLSLSAIEKRKLNLKEILSVKGSSDIELITEAKNKGLI